MDIKSFTNKQLLEEIARREAAYIAAGGLPWGYWIEGADKDSDWCGSLVVRGQSLARAYKCSDDKYDTSGPGSRLDTQEEAKERAFNYAKCERKYTPTAEYENLDGDGNPQAGSNPQGNGVPRQITASARLDALEKGGNSNSLRGQFKRTILARIRRDAANGRVVIVNAGAAIRSVVDEIASEGVKVEYAEGVITVRL
jgi:hypothetical protein